MLLKHMPKKPSHSATFRLHVKSYISLCRDVGSLVPSPSFFARRGGARRASRGGKKKGLVSNDRACVSFYQNSGNQDTCQDTFVYCWGQTS